MGRRPGPAVRTPVFRPLPPVDTGRDVTTRHYVAGQLSILSKLIGPRRLTDASHLERVGAEIYGGVYRKDPTLLKVYSRHIQAPRGLGFLYQLMAAAGWSSLPWRRALRQTTLIKHGSDDPIVPPSNAKVLAAGIGHATLHVIDDGHLFLNARATEVAPVLTRLLPQEES